MTAPSKTTEREDEAKLADEAEARLIVEEWLAECQPQPLFNFTQSEWLQHRIVQSFAALRRGLPPQPTGAREAPASCPNCHDRTDCSNVDQCNAVEHAYAHPTGDVEGLTTDEAVKWLTEAGRYFAKRDTKGEDMAFWSNVYNAENCEKIANLLRSADSRIAELLESAKGQLVVVNAANARTEAAEARVAELEKALRTIRSFRRGEK